MAGANSPQETSLDMNKLQSYITANRYKNPGISSATGGGSDCLPTHITMQWPSPVKNPSQLGNTFLNLNFQGVLFCLVSLSSSSPPFSKIIFWAFMFGFAISLAGVHLQNAFPKIALLSEKFGALGPAIGVSIIPGLVHPSHLWISCVGFGSFLIPFILSFK